MPSANNLPGELIHSIFKSPRVKRTMLRMVAAVSLGGGLLCVGTGIQNIKVVWDSQSWPKAEGKILSSNIKERTINDRKIHQAAVMYEYRIGSTVYHGSQIAVKKSATTDLATAQEQVNRFPAGKEITVHYQPFNPQVAVLDTDTPIRDWLMPLFGVLCLGVAIYFGLWLPRRHE